MKGILLMGLPACGKGTQSNKLVEHGYTYIGMGAILREHKEKGTEIGKLATKLDADGKLTPDHIIIKILDEEIQKRKATSIGFVFDGVVRTEAQAKAFVNMCALNGIDLLPVTITVDEDVVVKRSLARGLESARIEDSDIRIIKSRIAIYMTHKKAIDLYLKESGITCTVLNGIEAVDTITEDILSLLK